MTSKQKVYALLLILFYSEYNYAPGEESGLGSHSKTSDLETRIIEESMLPLRDHRSKSSCTSSRRKNGSTSLDYPSDTLKPSRSRISSLDYSEDSSSCSASMSEFEEELDDNPQPSASYPLVHPIYDLPHAIFSETYILPLYDPFNYEDERINNIYWQNKLDKLQEMIGDISSNEDSILMLLQEIISHAPEKYRYEAYNSFQSYNPRKKSLLDDELSLVYIPECLMYISKSEQKEEVVIHLTSDPKLFDRVFRVVPIRERPKVSEASRIRREKQEAEYREQQRIHAEQYKAKERALKRANGEDMVFDPRVGKRVHFEDYLRSLFLSQLAESRSRRRIR